MERLGHDRRLGAEAVVESVVASVVEFQADRAQAEDLALLVLRRPDAR